MLIDAALVQLEAALAQACRQRDEAFRRHAIVEIEACSRAADHEAVEKRAIAAETQVADLTRKLDEVQAVLREAEWESNYGLDANCPVCRAWKRNGHALNCALAAALDPSPNPPSVNTSDPVAEAERRGAASKAERVAREIARAAGLTVMPEDRPLGASARDEEGDHERK